MESKNEKLVVKLPINDSAIYGVSGNLSRQEWRDECYKKFLGGVSVFNAWTSQMTSQQIPLLRPNPDFSVEIHGIHNPGSLMRSGWSDQPGYFVIDFTNRVFEADAYFDQFYFPFGVIFSGATFKGLASFSGANFHNSAYFQNTRFLEMVIFSNSNFKKGAIFEYAIFKKMGIFISCTFEGALVFSNVECESDVTFQGSLIKYSNFNCSVFKGQANFSGENSNSKDLQSFGTISFSGVNFEGRADFSNRRFNGRTDFGIHFVTNEPTIFKQAPLFHNCELHQDTTFLDAIFININPDRLAAKAFNTLRNAMSKQQANREEQRFLTLELDAERLTTSGTHKYLYVVYKFLADYGFSVYRPIKWLIFIPGLIAGIFYGFIANSDGCIVLINQACHIDLDLTVKTIEFTLLQSLPPIGFDRLTYDLSGSLKNQSQLFGFIVIIQKIFSLAGWFFVALALRNMFKMK